MVFLLMGGGSERRWYGTHVGFSTDLRYLRWLPVIWFGCVLARTPTTSKEKLPCGISSHRWWWWLAALLLANAMQYHQSYNYRAHPAGLIRT